MQQQQQPVAFEQLVLAAKTENEKQMAMVMLLLRVLTRQHEMEPGLKKTEMRTGGCSEKSLKLQVKLQEKQQQQPEFEQEEQEVKKGNVLLETTAKPPDKK
jgi:hypothetical protein